MQQHAHFIDINQLCVGLYIHLDLGWLDHPFTLSNFKIQNDTQIDKIKKIGLKKLRYDPNRSDCTPLSLTPIKSDINVELAKRTHQVPTKKFEHTLPEAKQERLKQLQHTISQNEKKFVETSNIVKDINLHILTAPKKCVQQAKTIVSDMVTTALMEGDIAIHALNGHQSSDLHYQHSLNVTVLALMLAKSIDISEHETHLLGMSALLHDIGKAEIHEHILINKDTLAGSELTHYQEHSAKGARMATDAGLDARIAKVLLHHHEYADGSGFPLGLHSNEIDLLAKIITITNTYDNLCNPSNLFHAKTPYEALGVMYSQLRARFDEDLLKRFIKSLGIYPPGSIVKLSNSQYATVVSSNPNYPLRPYIKLHKPDSDPFSPTILDLREEATISITNCLRPSQLPPEVLSFISPRKNVSYFISPDSVPEAITA
ncbi:MAG TPA: phosphohydrolase [Methylophilaceae bacterium]|nr:phosphohydrolase [Methylophilaceae bacterium]HAJ70578.1 phosphohydrolase [Methylophilaceae bacterium]